MKSPRLVIASCLLTALLVVPPAFAAWDPDGVDVYGTSHSFSDFSIAPDGTGGILTWFLAYGGGQAYSYEAHRVSSDGTNAAGWGRLFDPTTGFAPDGQGGLYRAVYRGSGSLLDVYLTHSLSSGAPDPTWPGTSHEVGIAVSSAFESDAGCASDGAGGVIVGYISGSLANVRAKRVNSDGTLAAGWPANGAVVYPGNSGSLADYRTTLAPDGAGGAYVAFQTYQLTLQRITATGTIDPNWPSIGLPVSTTINGYEMHVVGWIPSDDDHFFVVWRDNAPSRLGLWVQRIDRSGSLGPGWPETGIQLFAGTVAGNAFSDGAGGLFTHWWDGTTLRVKRLDTNGQSVAPWPSSGATLATLGDAGNVPTGSGFAVPGSNGGIIVCWSDIRSPGPATLRARWLTADGAPDPTLSDPNQVLVAPQYTLISVLGLPDGNGGLFYEWQEDSHLNWYFVKAGHADRPQPNVGVDLSRAGAMTTLAITPNPARVGLSARVSLATATPARLELLDLAGRRIAAREIVGAGSHLERFDEPGGLAPGVYLVRLLQGQSVHTTRAAVLR